MIVQFPTSRHFWDLIIVHVGTLESLWLTTRMKLTCLSGLLIMIQHYVRRAKIEMTNLQFDANYLGNVNDEEFLLFYDVGGPQNHYTRLPHWEYDLFDLEGMRDNECLVEFRFTKDKVYRLVGTFHLPNVFRCYNG